MFGNHCTWHRINLLGHIQEVPIKRRLQSWPSCHSEFSRRMDQFHIRPHETNEPFRFCSGRGTQQWGLDGVRTMSPLFTHLLWAGRVARVSFSPDHPPVSWVLLSSPLHRQEAEPLTHQGLVHGAAVRPAGAGTRTWGSCFRLRQQVLSSLSSVVASGPSDCGALKCG